MKKQNFVYIGALFVAFIGYFIYSQFIVAENDEIVLEKQGYYFDCNNIRKDADGAIQLNDLIDEKEMVENDATLNYQGSNCVTMTGYSLMNYLKLDNFAIDHKKGRNDESYQVSYQRVLEELEEKKNKTELDKQLIEAIKFYVNDKNAVLLIPTARGDFQENNTLIGPTSQDESGKYELYINIDVVKNTIYKMQDNKKVFDEERFIFDGISMQYIKVGE